MTNLSACRAEEPSASAFAVTRKLGAYLELTKPRVALLVLAVSVAAFWMGTEGPPDTSRFICMTSGVALLAGGIFALNQYIERDLDRRMDRTNSRPLPMERLRPVEAAWFGFALSALGIGCLAAGVNLLSAAIGAFTFASYLFLYTPLKRITPHCTLIGAFPGATPPLLGWAAARGELAPAAWALFAILFFWQFPHFHAIASIYREDYARADIKMWPVVQPEGTVMGRQIIAFTALLLPASVVPPLLGVAGVAYFSGAVLLGIPFLYAAMRAANRKTRADTLRLLAASVLYLPALFALMALGK